MSVVTKLKLTVLSNSCFIRLLPFLRGAPPRECSVGPGEPIRGKDDQSMIDERGCIAQKRFVTEGEAIAARNFKHPQNGAAKAFLTRKEKARPSPRMKVSMKGDVATISPDHPVSSIRKMARMRGKSLSAIAVASATV
jgi:hypothetical protein